MKLYIRYMVSNRCKIVVKDVLKKFDLTFAMVDLGEVEIMEDITEEERESLREALLETGLELIDDKKAILIERIKAIIIDMVHYTEEDIKINFSDYLNEKLNHTYTYNYIANLFSDIQGTTIEQFIIFQKIERVKELIIYGELTITEIAYKMNYSSMAHLSAQFKKVTGFPPSYFKQLKEKRRSPIEEVGNSILNN